MPRLYPEQAPTVKAGRIDDATLHSIGRLIRATAEIEDIVDCFICVLADLNESKTSILLGKTAITRRLEIAESLSKLRTDEAHKIYKEAFPAEIADILECRNAVAHGILLGIGDGHEYAFITSLTNSVRGDAAVRIVVNYSPATIRNIADKAEAMIPYLEKRLLVQGLRSERLQRPLEPHPKSQDRGRAKPKPPPRS